MERSGRRETISTREKSLSARSRSVGRVSGKSIIVPRIGPRRNKKQTADAVAGFDAEILQRTSPFANGAQDKSVSLQDDTFRAGRCLKTQERGHRITNGVRRLGSGLCVKWRGAR